MKTFTVALFSVLSTLCTHEVGAQPKKGVLQEITGCFDEESTRQEKMQCLGEFTDCYDETTMDTIETCVEDNGGPGNGTRKECLEPYKTCVKDELKAILDKIPTCMRSSLKELGKCFKQNAETCSQTCSIAGDIPNSNPFEGLTAADIVGCDNFQEKIMDPTCEILDCCTECIEKYENLMSCITGEVLEFTTTFLSDETCTVECPAVDATVRRRRARKLATGDVEAPSDDEIGEQCAYYINVEGEEEGSDMFKASIQSKIVNSDFLACVAQESITVAENQAQYNEENPDSAGNVNHLNIVASAVSIMAMMFNF